MQAIIFVYRTITKNFYPGSYLTFGIFFFYDQNLGSKSIFLRFSQFLLTGDGLSERKNKKQNKRRIIEFACERRTRTDYGKCTV